MKNPQVDDYLRSGCGRCDLHDTPECRVHAWHAPLSELRRILLATGITEERKWGSPCYTAGGKNVILLGAFKEYCVISFLKGALLQDEQGVLQKPGEYSVAGRIIRFTDVADVIRLESILTNYIFEAIEVEKSGAKVTTTSSIPYPDELQQRFEEDLVFKQAFESLTPGKQKGYLIHFNDAKQPATRLARIDKYMPLILQGIGIHDAYKHKGK